MLIPFTRKLLLSLIIKKNEGKDNGNKIIEAEVIDDKKDEL